VYTVVIEKKGLSPFSTKQGLRLHGKISSWLQLRTGVTEVNAAAQQQHLLSTYSSPCFRVKILYNYGLWIR
jgi:hypothetical protein